MKKNTKKYMKVGIVLVIVLGFLWFLVISPMITFRNNEKTFEAAARDYFELNPGELPTGERVRTITLATLYHKAFLKKDLYTPYTHKVCDIDNSWVKVRKVDGEYKYYTYLECGLLSSTVDHKGPVIQLNGSSEITLDKGEAYEEAGVKSVVDSKDGKLDVTKVVISGEVKTSQVGEYKITYTAQDSLNNKTTVTRVVKVVQKLYSTVKGSIGEANNFKGDPSNNFIRLSSMLFRIYGVDENKNIIVVADEDIANVNYSKLDKWLDYYYDHLNETVQKMIVKKKYCNMTLTDSELEVTKCGKYTKERNIYIPSIVEINNAADENEYDFMDTNTLSWTANLKSKTEAYATRNISYEEDSDKLYNAYNVDYNYGVRPMFTIKGDVLITGGNGTSSNPYTLGDTSKAKSGSLVNDRYTGEYIIIDGSIYQIVDTEDDGTTRVISTFTVGRSNESVMCMANSSSDVIKYDPKDSSSVAYFINNKISEYVNTSHFVNHTVKVPVYKDKIIYGEEVKTEKIKVKVSAPDMYEMFAAQPQRYGSCFSYWLINSSQAKRTTGVVYLIGVPLNEQVPYNVSMYIRIAGYLKKGTVITSGDGTYRSPYIIK